MAAWRSHGHAQAVQTVLPTRQRQLFQVHLEGRPVAPVGFEFCRSYNVAQTSRCLV